MVKAIVCQQHGGLNTLKLQDINIDPPGPGQVHIRVRATGINFPDTLQIAGTYQTKTYPPFVPGQEVAGDVIACGEGVERFLPNDRVFAATGIGGGATLGTADIDIDGVSLRAVNSTSGTINIAEVDHIALDDVPARIVTKARAATYLASAFAFLGGVYGLATMVDKPSTTPFAPKTFPYNGLEVELGKK